MGRGVEGGQEGVGVRAEVAGVALMAVLSGG